MTESPASDSRRKVWVHGGYLSILVAVLVVAGVGLSFVVDPWVGVGVAGAGVALGMVVALHPLNRKSSRTP